MTAAAIASASIAASGDVLVMNTNFCSDGISSRFRSRLRHPALIKA
jgi:hypothetical protein